MRRRKNSWIVITDSEGNRQWTKVTGFKTQNQKLNIQCSICLESFYEDKPNKHPFFPSCSHSFCSSCIQAQERTKKIECPTCIVETCEPKKYDELLSLLNLAKDGFRDINESSTECSECERETDKACLMCKDLPPLCEQCFKITHNTPKRKSHQLSLFEYGTNPMCIEHPDEKCKLFCLDDNEVICLMCAHYGKHKNHDVKLFSDAIPVIKQKYSSCVEITKQNIASTNKQIMKLHQQLLDLQIQKLQLLKTQEILKRNEDSELNPIGFLKTWSKDGLNIYQETNPTKGLF